MTEDVILQNLTPIFRDVFDIPDLEIKPSMTADDVDGWDSVNHITLIVQTEQKFGIKFQTAELEDLRNVGEFVRLIASKSPRA